MILSLYRFPDTRPLNIVFTFEVLPPFLRLLLFTLCHVDVFWSISTQQSLTSYASKTNFPSWPFPAHPLAIWPRPPHLKQWRHWRPSPFFWWHSLQPHSSGERCLQSCLPASANAWTSAWISALISLWISFISGAGGRCWAPSSVASCEVLTTVWTFALLCLSCRSISWWAAMFTFSRSTSSLILGSNPRSGLRSFLMASLARPVRTECSNMHCTSSWSYRKAE